MAKVRYRVVVSGYVQGVNFRAATRAQALSHSVTGWVRNLSDERVEAVFEGEQEDVERLVAWCRRGPSSARVTDVRVTPETYTGKFIDFEVLFWGWS